MIVELAPEALVNMLTKAPGPSISLLTKLCRQQRFDGLVGERSKPACISGLKAVWLHLRVRLHDGSQPSKGIRAWCTAAKHHAGCCWWPNVQQFCDCLKTQALASNKHHVAYGALCCARYRSSHLTCRCWKLGRSGAAWASLLMSSWGRLHACGCGNWPRHCTPRKRLMAGQW